MSNYQIDKVEYNNNIYKIQDNVSGYTTYTGNITKVQLNNQAVATSGIAQLTVAQLSDIIYPVGCYYETSDSNFNPQTAWGGTWELEEEGITHVGANDDNNPLVGVNISASIDTHTYNFGTTDTQGRIYINSDFYSALENYYEDCTFQINTYGTIIWRTGHEIDCMINGNDFENIYTTSNGNFIRTIYDSKQNYIYFYTVTHKNLLDDPLKDAFVTHTTYNVADFNFNTSLVAGQMYTVTAKINTSSEKKSIGFYHSGGSYQMTNPHNSWLSINETGIYSVVFIATTEMAAQTSGSGHGFCRVYASNNENAIQGNTAITGTANVDWIIVEGGCRLGAIGGDTVTKYTPAFTIPGYAITNNDIQTHTHTASKQGNSFTRTFRQRYNGTGLTDASKLAAVGAFATGRTASGNTGGSGISYLNANAVSQTGGYDVITINFAHTHTSVGGGKTHTHTFSSSSTDISIMQPYIVVKRWHKIGPAS